MCCVAYKRIICLLVLFLLVLSGCRDENHNIHDVEEIEMYVNINEKTSRVALAQYTTANIETIGVFIAQQTSAYKYENRKIDKQANGDWKLSEGGGTMEWESPGNPCADVIAYAPYQTTISANGEIDVSVTDQSAADLIWMNETVDKNMLVNGKIPISLYHQFSKVTFRFVLGVQTPTVDPNIEELKIINIHTTGVFDVDDASLLLDAVTGEVQVDSVEGDAKVDTIRVYQAIILPQMVQKSTNFLYVKIDGVDRRIPLSASSDRFFESGKNYIITVRIGSNNMEIAPTLEVAPWVEDQSLLSSVPTMGECVRITGANDDHLWAASIDTLRQWVEVQPNQDVVEKIKYLTVAGDRGDWKYLKKLGASSSANGVTWGGIMKNLQIVKLIDVTQIVDSMFFIWNPTTRSGKGFDSMTSFSAPNAVSVEDYAFRGCSQMSSIYLPRVKKIGNNVFHYCSAGIKQVIMDDVEEMGENVFEQTTAIEYIQMNKLAALPNSLCSVSSLKTTLKTLKMNALKELPASYFKEYKSLEHVEMNEILTIEQYAFQNCSHLAYVEMINVSRIKANAFKACLNLKTLKLNQSSVIVEADAFSGVTTSSCVLYLNATDPAIGTVTWQGRTWKEIRAY